LPRASQVNPDWSFDELILALDLYLRLRPKQPPRGHPDLETLSDLLRRLPLHPPGPRAESFRNANRSAQAR
jgi:5-methylcytosine-specific restriction protein A